MKQRCRDDLAMRFTHHDIAAMPVYMEFHLMSTGRNSGSWAGST